MKENNSSFKETDDQNTHLFLNEVYHFLIEVDKFKNDIYHQIFYYAYLRKYKFTQNYIAMCIRTDQSTVSRKLKEIHQYMLLKQAEKKKL